MNQSLKNTVTFLFLTKEVYLLFITFFVLYRNWKSLSTFLHLISNILQTPGFLTVMTSIWRKNNVICQLNYPKLIGLQCSTSRPTVLQYVEYLLELGSAAISLIGCNSCDTSIAISCFDLSSILYTCKLLEL